MKRFLLRPNIDLLRNKFKIGRFRMILRNNLFSDRIELVSYSELRQYLKWLEDLDVVKYLNVEDLLIPKGLEFIEQSFERFTQKDSIGFFIRVIKTGEVIGNVKLSNINHYKRSANDGIMIGEKDWWGKGIFYEAFLLLLDYGFNTLGLNRITGGCNVNNLGIPKTLERIGYKKEGELRHADYINGEYSNHLIYGIKREEFLNHISSLRK
jgi:RimJ/RimL family protein N-acetyltransferase